MMTSNNLKIGMNANDNNMFCTRRHRRNRRKTVLIAALAAIIIIFSLSGCEIPCERPAAAHEFKIGEKVLFTETGETARVVRKFEDVFTNGACRTTYHVAFPDEPNLIRVNPEDLEKI